jgi:hypothetical protein
MDKFTIIVISFIAFNVGLVTAIMWYVRKVKLDQIKRQGRVVNLAKRNEDLTELLRTKDSLLDKYRHLVNKMF